MRAGMAILIFYEIYTKLPSPRCALRDRLTEVEWMREDATREEALRKMAAFRSKIGNYIRFNPTSL